MKNRKIFFKYLKNLQNFIYQLLDKFINPRIYHSLFLIKKDNTSPPKDNKINENSQKIYKFISTKYLTNLSIGGYTIPCFL